MEGRVPVGALLYMKAASLIDALDSTMARLGPRVQ
jgi:hypothetical protein